MAYKKAIVRVSSAVLLKSPLLCIFKLYAAEFQKVTQGIPREIHRKLAPKVHPTLQVDGSRHPATEPSRPRHRKRRRNP